MLPRFSLRKSIFQFINRSRDLATTVAYQERPYTTGSACPWTNTIAPVITGLIYTRGTGGRARRLFAPIALLQDLIGDSLAGYEAVRGIARVAVSSIPEN